MVDERFQLERKNTTDNKNKQNEVELINFNKIVLLSSIVKRVTVCANSDAIQDNQDLGTFQALMEAILPIDEDYIWQLSYSIKPKQEFIDYDDDY